jgi:hypothetical protein
VTLSQVAISDAAIIIAFSALIVSAMTFFRAGPRKRTKQETDEWAAHLASVEAIRSAVEGLDGRVDAASRWHDTDKAQALKGRVTVVESRMALLEERLTNLPTKADLGEFRGEVKGELNTIRHMASNASMKIDGVERYLLEHKS